MLKWRRDGPTEGDGWKSAGRLFNLGLFLKNLVFWNLRTDAPGGENLVVHLLELQSQWGRQFVQRHLLKVTPVGDEGQGGVYSGRRSSPSSSSANSSSSRRFLAPVLGLSAWGPRGSTYEASAQDRKSGGWCGGGRGRGHSTAHSPSSLGLLVS